MKSPLWKLLLFAAIILLFIAVISYLAKPLPPPRVSIELQGFNPGKTSVFHLEPATNSNDEVFLQGEGNDWWFRAFLSVTKFLPEQTNALWTLYLTNRGSTRIWWLSHDCQVEARTTNGWITNKFGHFTISPWSVGASRADMFKIYVPAGAIEWRVTGEYGYSKRHDARLEFIGWLTDDLGLGRTNHIPEIVAYPLGAVAWILQLLPKPQTEYGKVSTPFFTNKPPVEAISANKPES